MGHKLNTLKIQGLNCCKTGTFSATPVLGIITEYQIYWVLWKYLEWLVCNKEKLNFYGKHLSKYIRKPKYIETQASTIPLYAEKCVNRFVAWGTTRIYNYTSRWLHMYSDIREVSACDIGITLKTRDRRFNYNKRSGTHLHAYHI